MFCYHCGKLICGAKTKNIIKHDDNFIRSKKRWTYLLEKCKSKKKCLNCQKDIIVIKRL